MSDKTNIKVQPSTYDKLQEIGRRQGGISRDTTIVMLINCYERHCEDRRESVARRMGSILNSPLVTKLKPGESFMDAIARGKIQKNEYLQGVRIRPNHGGRPVGVKELKPRIRRHKLPGLSRELALVGAK